MRKAFGLHILLNTAETDPFNESTVIVFSGVACVLLYVVVFNKRVGTPQSWLWNNVRTDRSLHALLEWNACHLWKRIVSSHLRVAENSVESPNRAMRVFAVCLDALQMLREFLGPNENGFSVCSTVQRGFGTVLEWFLFVGMSFSEGERIGMWTEHHFRKQSVYSRIQSILKDCHFLSSNCIRFLRSFFASSHCHNPQAFTIFHCCVYNLPKKLYSEWFLHYPFPQCQNKCRHRFPALKTTEMRFDLADAKDPCTSDLGPCQDLPHLWWCFSSSWRVLCFRIPWHRFIPSAPPRTNGSASRSNTIIASQEEPSTSSNLQHTSNRQWKTISHWKSFETTSPTMPN